MHVHVFKRTVLAWALPLLVLLPGGLEAQLRPVLSNEIAVSGREASLRLDFETHEVFTIALSGGEVLVDGDQVGSYTQGDALDQAWRSLLGQVISLDDGPLSRALNDWTPPGELTGISAEIAAALDGALEAALALPEEVQDPISGAEISLTLGDEGSLLGALLSRTGALQGLAEALQEVSVNNFTLRIGEDVEIEAGEELDQSLIIVDGDLELRGTVLGDVTISNGTVRLRDGSRVTGDLRVADGHVEAMGGEVEGSILDLDTESFIALDPADLEDLREELTREIRRDLRSSMEREGRSSSPFFSSTFVNIGRAVGGIMEKLLTLLVLVILGVLTVHFGKDRLEVVATTARRAPAQSAMVGLAGGFLLIPILILGIVALLASIVGIPIILAWVPLFLIAVAIAALLGYVAVARNVGEWVADQEYKGLEWIRGSNIFYVVVAGLATLMIPAIAASAVRILGLGLLHGLLTFVASAITFAAVAIGFGAVLLTRGGRIRPYAAYYEFEEELWAEEAAADPTQEPVTEESPPEEEAREAEAREAEAKEAEAKEAEVRDEETVSDA
jgi:hypothetical protein